jgi:dTDP-4-dehydrorhamnose reductase
MEAARVRAEGVGGWRVLVNEAWQRYGLPIALTEVHLGSTRDEQLRWLAEAWTTSETLRAEDGVDIRAVTAWSLFGAFDWNHLVTCTHGFYEAGVFDWRSPVPRPTALAGLVRELAHGRVPDHPVFDVPGWWRRPDRLTVPPVLTEFHSTPKIAVRRAARKPPTVRPVLITGASGTLGRAFARICHERGLPHQLVSRQEMDIANRRSVEQVLDALRPWAIINTAGYVRVDDAERDVERCMRENARGPEILAEACAANRGRLVTFSSDLVFDGTKDAPYVEGDRVDPLNVYGRSKAEAEQRVLAADPTALVVRTSAFFGPWDPHNFVFAALRALAAGELFVAASDSVVSPTYVPDLVHATLDLLLDGETGIWHLANDGALSWADLARRAAECAGVAAGGVQARSTAELGWAAARPRVSALRSQRGWIMPPLDDALARFIADGVGTLRRP